MRSLGFYYYYVLEYSPAIPLLFGLFRYNELAPSIKLFFWYLVCSLLFTILMTIVAFTSGNNLWLMNLALPVYTAMIMWMYSLWREPDSTRRWYLLSVIVVIIVWLVEMTFFNRLKSYTIVARPLQGFLFFAVACSTIYRMNRSLELPLTELPQFWISSGLLIYFGGIIIVSLLSHWMLTLSTETFKSVLLIQATVNFIAHLIFIGGFTCRYPSQRYFGSSSSVQPS